MNISAWLELVERFTSPHVQHDPARCLNARHPKAHCTRCVEICPTEAITLSEERPNLDAEACARCGACLWECPNAVFDEAYLPEARLISTVAQLNTPAALACPLAATEGLHLAEGVTVQTPRCLAALSPATLIELAETQPTLWLNDSRCAACPLSTAHASILRAAHQANTWLATYGRDGRVRLFSRDRPSLAETPGSKPIQGDKPHIRRRALLRGKIGRKTVVNAPTTPITAENPVNARLTYALPRERVRLVLLIRRWPPPPEQIVAPRQHGFAHITIAQERCTLCGWCAGFCPTAALERKQEGENLQLVFHPLRCIDCAICLEACPTQALDKAEKFPAQYMHDVILLAEGTAHVCPRCGHLTADEHGDLCIWCQEQPASSAEQLGLPWERLFPPPEDKSA